MKTNKTLHILECYFNLPDDFDGSVGDALLLMATRAKAAEAYNETNIRYEKPNFDMYNHLRNNDRVKCTIKYEILDT